VVSAAYPRQSNEMQAAAPREMAWDFTVTTLRRYSARSSATAIPCWLARLFHHAQRIFPEDFANVGIRIAAAHQRFRDFGSSRHFHAFGHIRTVKSNPTNVIGTDELDEVIDVVDIFPS